MLWRLPFSMEMLSVPKMLRVVRRRLLLLLPLLRGTTGATESSLTCDAESVEGGVELEFGEVVGVSVVRERPLVHHVPTHSPMDGRSARGRMVLSSGLASAPGRGTGELATGNWMPFVGVCTPLSVGVGGSSRGRLRGTTSSSIASVRDSVSD